MLSTTYACTEYPGNIDFATKIPYNAKCKFVSKMLIGKNRGRSSYYTRDFCDSGMLLCIHAFHTI